MIVWIVIKGFQSWQTFSSSTSNLGSRPKPCCRAGTGFRNHSSQQGRPSLLTVYIQDPGFRSWPVARPPERQESQHPPFQTFTWNISGPQNLATFLTNGGPYRVFERSS